MAKRQNVEVRINTHTLSIAGQIYQLRTIARVQSLKVTSTPFRNVLGGALGALILLAVLNAVVVWASNGGLSNALQQFDLFAFVAIGLVVLVRLARTVSRRPVYVLLIEMAGNPIGVLASTHRREIENLVYEIANALENPPLNPKLIQVGDVIMGDKIKVGGQGNTGKSVTIGG